MAVKPLSSYPKEFLDMWNLALAGGLSITKESRGAAINLRARMYAFRKRGFEEAPAMFAPFADVDISMPVPLPNGEWELKVEIPKWKLQVRAQLAARPTPTPPPQLAIDPSLPHRWQGSANSNICQVCGGYELDARHVGRPERPPQAAPETPDAMDSTLQHLGFGTEQK